MAGNPRENTKNKGFWDGGSQHHGRPAAENAGRSGGYPGPRRANRFGVRIDLSQPVAGSGPDTPGTTNDDVTSGSSR